MTLCFRLGAGPEQRTTINHIGAAIYFERLMQRHGYTVRRIENGPLG